MNQNPKRHLLPAIEQKINGASQGNLVKKTSVGKFIVPSKIEKYFMPKRLQKLASRWDGMMKGLTRCRSKGIFFSVGL